MTYNAISRKDGTNERYNPGRCINHKCKMGNRNLLPKVHEVDSMPRIIFFAEIDIQKGSELFYDYSDHRKSVVEQNPWMTNDHYVGPVSNRPAHTAVRG